VKSGESIPALTSLFTPILQFDILRTALPMAATPEVMVHALRTGGIFGPDPRTRAASTSGASCRAPDRQGSGASHRRHPDPTSVHSGADRQPKINAR
jgi:hypothetical protein